MSQHISYFRKYFSRKDPEGGTGGPDPPPSKITSGYRFSWKFCYGSPSRSNWTPSVQLLGPLWSDSFSRVVGTALCVLRCQEPDTPFPTEFLDPYMFLPVYYSSLAIIHLFGEFLFWPFFPLSAKIKRCHK